MKISTYDIASLGGLMHTYFELSGIFPELTITEQKEVVQLKSYVNEALGRQWLIIVGHRNAQTKEGCLWSQTRDFAVCR
jgi:hypothetical protein